MITRRCMLVASSGLAAMVAAKPAASKMPDRPTKERNDGNHAVTVRNHHVKDRRSISPAPFALIRCSRRPNQHV